MRSTFRTRAVITLAAAAFIMLVPLAAASAHTGTSVGKIEMETGFVNEPAYVGQPNGVAADPEARGQARQRPRRRRDGPGQLRRRDHGAADARAVRSSTRTARSSPAPRASTEYSFIPSQPGPYTFHFQGTVDGQKIDESFTSGPKTFDEVVDPVTASFPAVTAPTNDELATRLDQEATRTDDAVTQAEAAASDAQSAADSAKTIAMVGLLVGTIGVIAAITALVTRKRA